MPDRRTVAGWFALVLGALLALAGLVAAVMLGPDSRFTTGPHAIDTNAAAVVTQPKVISWMDLRIELLAEVPVNKPVFVGLANSVDVRDYVARSARVEITSFHTPWDLKTKELDGLPVLPAAPTALDWWIAGAAGLGGAQLSTTLPDETVSVAVIAVGDTNLKGLELTFAYGMEGGFLKALGALLAGLGLALIGWLLRRSVLPTTPAEAAGKTVVEEEEVVYVYVDEDGVEHELTAEEFAALEDVEVVHEEEVEK